MPNCQLCHQGEKMRGPFDLSRLIQVWKSYDLNYWTDGIKGIIGDLCGWILNGGLRSLIGLGFFVCLNY